MGQTAIVTPQIIDSTSIGRDLLTAVDQASAQSIIGVTGVDTGGDYTWTGDHTFDNGLSTDAITSTSLTNTYASAGSHTYTFGVNPKYFMNATNFRPADGDGDIALGIDGRRWGSVASVDGDFSGVIKATGGLDIDSGQMHIKHAGSFRVGIGGAGIFMYEDVLPNYSTITNGTSTKRWGNTYSVDGDFSGTVTASDIQESTGAGNISLTTDGGSLNRFADSALQWGFNFLRLKGNVEQWNGGAGNFTLGTSSVPWNNTYSIDGDFSGVLNTDEVNSDTLLKLGGSVGVAYRGLELDTTNGTLKWKYNNIAKLTVNSTTCTIGTNTLIANDVRADNIRPLADDTYALGESGFRWSDVYSIDGSFSGNLTSEAGGSYKQYKLGTEGDTDTEFYEASFDGNVYKMYSKATGSGAEPQLEFGSADCQINVKPAFNQAVIRTGGSARLVAENGSVYVTTNFRPSSNGLIATGTSSQRWSNVYSVAGNFSGTVTSNNFSGDGTGSIFIESPSTNPIYVKHNGAVSYGIFDTTFRPTSNGAVELGLSTNRWENVYSVDGSFSGNLVSEVGGSYNLYNLGSGGDTDTEFGGFNWVGNALQIGTHKTGSGTSRNLQFMVGDSTRLYLTSNALTTYTNVAPSSNGSHNLGSATKYYARAFTSATFNSLQTITAAADSLSTTDTTNLCDCTSNAIAITIPSGSTSQVGNEYVIKKIDSSANAVTITATGATIDGAATKTLATQYETAKLVSDGTNWFLI